MAWLIRALRVPASESHLSIVIVICAVVMSLMSVALVWQATVITQQRDIIRWLEHLKLGA